MYEPSPAAFWPFLLVCRRIAALFAEATEACGDDDEIPLERRRLALGEAYWKTHHRRTRIMSDPHVEALYYEVKPGDGTDYDQAVLLTHERAKFRVEVKDGTAKFEMKEHFATQEDAVECVRPFVRAWEIQSDLTSEPGSFRLAFRNSHIIDRDPSPPKTGASASL